MIRAVLLLWRCREQISNVIIAIERGTYIRIEDMKVKTIPVNENERGFHAIG
jgi:hypothetical protein